MAEKAKRIVVLGLGGGGGKIVATLAAEPTLDGNVTLAVADTDQRALEGLEGVVQVPLGRDWAWKDGCGGNSTKGEKAAAIAAGDLRQLVTGADLVIVVAGLGGGTGAGAARVMARHLRELEVMNLFVATLPFSFEGNWRCHQAEKDLEILRGMCETAMSIPNDLLFADLPANTAIADAFEASNRLLARGINGLVRLPQATAILTVDFAALRNLLREKPGVCTLGIGYGSGPDRWQEVARNFFACPLVGGPENLARTDAAILTLIGGETLSVGEIQSCMAALQQQFPRTAKIMVGAYSDPRMRDSLQLTGLVCRFAGEPAIPPAARENAAAAGAVITPGRRAGKRRPAAGGAGTGVQGELLLQEPALGIFSSTAATTVDGENLDIPTFQRRGVYLDEGT
jgi:cell division protein FtsZ